MPIFPQRVKTCDQCQAQFFFAQGGGGAGYEVVCQNDSAFFCSPYCRSLWLMDQFKELEEAVYGDNDASPPQQPQQHPQQQTKEKNE